MRAVVLLMVALALPPAAAHAQGASDEPVRRFEVSVGGLFLGGAPLGGKEAELRASGSTTPYRLFSTSSEFASAGGFDLRAGFSLTRRLAIEGGVIVTHPELRTSITADAESAPPLTVVERVDQYMVTAGLVFLIDELRIGTRTVPFVSGGAGYLRQLHEGQTVVESGHVYHLGGGLRHRFFARAGGIVRAAGVRADARLYLLARGIAFADEGPRSHGAISGSFYVTF